MFVQLTVPLRAYAGAYVEEASVGKATLLDTVNFASTHNPSVALLGTAITVVLLWAASRFKVCVCVHHVCGDALERSHFYNYLKFYIKIR